MGRDFIDDPDICLKKRPRRVALVTEVWYLGKMSFEENIRANAELVVQHMSQHAGFELDYDESSIEWLDGLIERQRVKDDFDLETNRGLSDKLGCFLGEALCVNLGGEWQQTEYGLGVVFSDGNTAFPFTKVEKQFANGSDDSIFSFYRTALTLFGNSQPDS